MLGDLRELMERNHAVRMLESCAPDALQSEVAKLTPRQRDELADAFVRREVSPDDVIQEAADEMSRCLTFLCTGSAVCTTDPSYLSPSGMWGFNAFVGGVGSVSHVEGRCSDSTVAPQVTAVTHCIILTLALNDWQRVVSSHSVDAPSCGDAPPKDMFDGASMEDMRLMTQLGEGSFGKVMTAHHPIKGVVAIKMINMVEIKELGIQSSVSSEIEMLRLFRPCPFVVDIYGAIESAAGIMNIVMERIPGGDLQARLDSLEEGQLPASDCVFITACLVSALITMHDELVVFRDLKPPNVMFDASGRVKIVDFGLAKRVSLNTFTVCGTLEYMAPEIIAVSS